MAWYWILYVHKMKRVCLKWYLIHSFQWRWYFFKWLALISLVFFKCWFRFELFFFKYVVHNKRINFLVKMCDSWEIHGSRGNTFQMIIFDLVNSIFKCWFRFECFCFKYVVQTKRIKIIVNRYINFSNNELWWKLALYFIYHFSSFWEARCFWVDSNQFSFNLFWFLILLFYEIHQLFFWLFKNLIRFIKLGLEFSLKAIFRR